MQSSVEETDRLYAEKLQLELNQETDPQPFSPSTVGIVLSVHEFLKNLALKVHTTDQFFIVTRRGASLDRRLALWKRESLKSSPIKKLIHSGINSGAPGGACRKNFLV